MQELTTNIQLNSYPNNPYDLLMIGRIDKDKLVEPPFVIEIMSQKILVTNLPQNCLENTVKNTFVHEKSLK